MRAKDGFASTTSSKRLWFCRCSGSDLDPEFSVIPYTISYRYSTFPRPCQLLLVSLQLLASYLLDGIPTIADFFAAAVKFAIDNVLAASNVPVATGVPAGAHVLAV